jgi:hypothetical protein
MRQVCMIDKETPPSSRVKRKEQLLWLASLFLALLVVCCGCGFFFSVGLMSRGELTANVLGADFRLWRIVEKNEVGLGFDRALESRQDDRSCTQHYTLIVLWKPALAIDNLAYADCS